MKSTKYTLEEVKSAVRKCHMKSGVLRMLGLVPAGGNYATLNALISKHNLDTRHFKRSFPFEERALRVPIEEYLSNRRSIKSHSLKIRLLREGILEPVCKSCGGTTWLGGPIPLELDHIDGNNSDNRLQNLRLLCPNCHALTPTYRGKNVKRPEAKACLDCGSCITKSSVRCKSCAGKHREPTKIDWPETQVLIELVANSSYCSVARELGVSDNAVRKRIKRHS